MDPEGAFTVCLRNKGESKPAWVTVSLGKGLTLAVRVRVKVDAV